MLLRQVRSFATNGRRALDALRSTSALDWQFSRASGPGGQHVNKVNTRAELRLDLDRAADTAALPRAVADRLSLGLCLLISLAPIKILHLRPNFFAAIESILPA